MGLSKQQKQELDVQLDMLNGNINRMCVTDDVDELNSMYGYAKKRLLIIMLTNVERIKNEK